VIDLGPEGGAGGGQIVAQGTPEDIAATANSYTGAWLKPLLAGHVGSNTAHHASHKHDPHPEANR
jgi:excinuclease ABC subunit A